MDAQPSPEGSSAPPSGPDPSQLDVAPGFGPRRRAIWSVVVSVLFLGQVALGVRSRIHDDDRYGFAMFHEFTSLSLRYRWRMDDGTTVSFRPDKYLKGRARAVRGSGRRTEVFGAGTTRIQAQGFVKWLYERKRPDNAVAAEVVYSWERNKDGEKHKELIVWPLAEARP